MSGPLGSPLWELVTLGGYYGYSVMSTHRTVNVSSFGILLWELIMLIWYYQYSVTFFTSHSDVWSLELVSLGG